ncbi:hypothetical protein DYY62_04110 [Pasteurella multocida]|uniref:hypothetical protein n=1 Tax=Pasteurella multocida TaxID=747 RepID=UPI000E3030F4|nr:hypothetical protein DYY62_04110 [Pasteurella multocida]
MSNLKIKTHYSAMEIASFKLNSAHTHTKMYKKKQNVSVGSHVNVKVVVVDLNMHLRVYRKKFKLKFY